MRRIEVRQLGIGTSDSSVQTVGGQRPHNQPFSLRMEVPLDEPSVFSGCRSFSDSNAVYTSQARIQRIAKITAMKLMIQTTVRYAL